MCLERWVSTSVGWISLFFNIRRVRILKFLPYASVLLIFSLIIFRGQIQVSNLDFVFSKPVLKFPVLAYVRAVGYLHWFSWTSFHLQFPFKSFKLLLELFTNYYLKFRFTAHVIFQVFFQPTNVFWVIFLMNKHFFPTFSQPTIIFSNSTNPQLHPTPKNFQILLALFLNLHLCQWILLN